MRKILIASLLVSSPALADFTAKDASLATITFKNPNVCTSVACVPIFQQTDGSGAAIGVAGSPLYFAFGTGVTLPAFTSTPTFNLGTIGTAATAAAQTSGNASLTSLDAKTPALGQAVAGSSSPVVLPATQITALTPPAAITGFALESGGNLASLVAQIGAVTASPTANTVLDRLKALNTTLGTPFQAGGSIGNTAFGISGTLPAFASTPTVNVGTMPTTTVTGTVSVGNFPATQPISAAALPLPTGAATAANQTNATAKTQIVDGSGNVIASTTNALNVNCANCSGGGGGGTSSNFAATFPTAGTAAGMSQGGNMVALTGTSGSLNANVTNFPATQPVSGTFWQATQPVSGTFFQATQPVSNAGTFATQVTSLPALSAGANAIGSVSVSNFPGTQAVSGTVTANLGTANVTNAGTFAVQVTSAPSTAVTNVGTFATQVTSLPSIPTGSNTIGALTANQTVNNAQVSGTAIAVNNGVVGAGVQRVAIASDNSPVPIYVAPSAATAAGITPTTSGAAVSSLVLKSAPGNLYTSYAINLTATAGYCVLINATSAPTSGTGVGIIEAAALPPFGTCQIGNGIQPSAFSTGITFLVTSNASPYVYTSGVITAVISGKAI